VSGCELFEVEVAFEEMMEKRRHDVRTLSEHEIQMV
jgi:phage head maturation protease